MHIVTTSGEVVGQHGGIHNFTVGQRKGLGVATGSPLYVLEIKGEMKQVVVGSGNELYSQTMRVKSLNWIAIEKLGQLDQLGQLHNLEKPDPLGNFEKCDPLDNLEKPDPPDKRDQPHQRDASLRVTAKIRHGHQAAPATIESTGADTVLVTFDHPQRAVTPGQAAVFYYGDIVIGGGWIA